MTYRARCVQSMGLMLLESIGAYVAFALSCGVRFAVPASMARTVSQARSPAMTASRAISSLLVSIGSMGVLRISMTSPSSIPAVRYIALTPVSSQWFRIDHCTGPAPRRDGRMLACLLMQPYFGMSSTRCGKILP